MSEPQFWDRLARDKKRRARLRNRLECVRSTGSICSSNCESATSAADNSHRIRSNGAVQGSGKGSVDSMFIEFDGLSVNSSLDSIHSSSTIHYNEKQSTMNEQWPLNKLRESHYAPPPSQEEARRIMRARTSSDSKASLLDFALQPLKETKSYNDERFNSRDGENDSLPVAALPQSSRPDTSQRFLNRSYATAKTTFDNSDDNLSPITCSTAITFPPFSELPLPPMPISPTLKPSSITGREYLLHGGALPPPPPASTGQSSLYQVDPIKTGSNHVDHETNHVYSQADLNHLSRHSRRNSRLYASNRSLNSRCEDCAQDLDSPPREQKLRRNSRRESVDTIYTSFSIMDIVHRKFEEEEAARMLRSEQEDMEYDAGLHTTSRPTFPSRNYASLEDLLSDEDNSSDESEIIDASVCRNHATHYDGQHHRTSTQDPAQRKLEQDQQERAIAAGVRRSSRDSAISAMIEDARQQILEEVLDHQQQDDSPTTHRRAFSDSLDQERRDQMQKRRVASLNVLDHENNGQQEKRRFASTAIGSGARAAFNTLHPGAIPVSGISVSESLNDCQKVVDCTNLDHEATATTVPTMSTSESPSGTSQYGVLAVAAMIVEDYEREQIMQKERELKAKEDALAVKMARLEAWEEELRHRRWELENQEAKIVEAQIVPSLPDSPRRTRSSTWNLFQRISESTHGILDAKTEDVNDSLGSLIEEDDLSRGHTDEHLVAQEARASGMVDLSLAEMETTPGAMRFALRGERSLEEQIKDMTVRDKLACSNLRRRLADRKAKALASRGRAKKKVILEFPLDWQLRFLRHYTHKDGSFYEERAFRASTKLQKRFLNLRVHPLVEQLQTKTLFPVPGLKTKEGNDMFYMRPSRYNPGETSTRVIIDNLCYVMNTMLEREHAQKHGIGFIACMDDWKMRNFDVNYCYQFMMGLQAVLVPVKTQLFLIVNPPAWFGVIWRVMKPMLAPSFRKRVKICPEGKISKYLLQGFEEFLPDDMQTGRARTDEIVEDFIAFRLYAEKDDQNLSEIDSSESASGLGIDDGDLGRLARHHLSDRSLFSGGSRSGMLSSGASVVSSMDASIHCDIDNEEASIDVHALGEEAFEDLKPAAVPRSHPGKEKVSVQEICIPNDDNNSKFSASKDASSIEDPYLGEDFVQDLKPAAVSRKNSRAKKIRATKLLRKKSQKTTIGGTGIDAPDLGDEYVDNLKPAVISRPHKMRSQRVANTASLKPPPPTISLPRQNPSPTFTRHPPSSSMRSVPLSSSSFSRRGLLSSVSTSMWSEQNSLSRLGPGPARFSTLGERTLEEQLLELSDQDKRAYRLLNERWKKHQIKVKNHQGQNKYPFEIPIEWQLRYLHQTARKDGSFVEDRAYGAMLKLKRRYLNLRASTLARQLETKTIFPVPGLKTKGGHDMFYMRPSRYFPGKRNMRDIIDNLCYVINTMLEKEHARNHGVGFIACLDDWKMKNFEINYCYQFMMALQGFMVPVQTQLFLIVNPPSWFGAVWRIMKPMLAPSFRKRVKICRESKMSKYLSPGFEYFLPDDMQSGHAVTDTLVADFLAYRFFAERGAYLVANDESSSSDEVSTTGTNCGQGRHKNFALDESELKIVNPQWTSLVAMHECPDDCDEEASIHTDINQQHLAVSGDIAFSE